MPVFHIFFKRVISGGEISPGGVSRKGNISRGYLRWGEYLQVCLW